MSHRKKSRKDATETGHSARPKSQRKSAGPVRAASLKKPQRKLSQSRKHALKPSKGKNRKTRFIVEWNIKIEVDAIDKNAARSIAVTELLNRLVNKYQIPINYAVPIIDTIRHIGYCSCYKIPEEEEEEEVRTFRKECDDNATK